MPPRMPLANNSREEVAPRKQPEEHIVLSRCEDRDRPNLSPRRPELAVQAGVVDRAGHDGGPPNRQTHLRNRLQQNTDSKAVRNKRNAGSAAEIGIEKRRDQASRVVGNPGLSG